MPRITSLMRGFVFRKNIWNCESFRRILPFLVAFIVYEIVESLVVAFGNSSLADFTMHRFFSVTVGLLCECFSSFLFQLIPYWLYLAALPDVFHGGRTDRLLTLLFFVLFCTVNCCEEAAEILCAGNLSFCSFRFLQNPVQIWHDFLESAPLFLLLFGIVGTVSLTALIGYRYLIPKAVTIPHTAIRYSVPLFAAGGAFAVASVGQSVHRSTEFGCFAGEAFFDFFGDLYALTPLPDLPKIFTVPIYECIAATLFVCFIWAVWRKRTARHLSCAKYSGVLCMRNAVCALLIVVLIIRLISLGSYPLMDTTEARYGEIARKMLETGNYLTPQFDYGVPFWGKPPLSFWGSAFTMQLFGVGEWSARLAPFLASLVLGFLMLAWKYERDPQTQALGAWFVLATSVMGFVASGAVMTDEFLTLGVTLSMISFWKTLSRTSDKKWGYLFFVGLAISALSKGLVGIVLTALPIFLWTIICRRWRDCLSLIPWESGIPIFLLLTLPWYIAAEYATPGFLRYFIVGEHFERFIVKGWQGDLYGSGHSRAFGSIWVYGFTMFLPWSIILLLSFFKRIPKEKKDGEDENTRSETIFLILWATSPLIFFTVARNILPAYVLPGLPALSILTVRRLWHLDAHCHGIKNLIFVPTGLLAVMALFLLGDGFEHIEYRCQAKLLQAWDGVSPLYYLCEERVPYSAQFYSRGHAQLADRMQPCTATVWFAVRKNDDTQLPEWRKWQFVASEREWALYRSEHSQNADKR